MKAGKIVQLDPNMPLDLRLIILIGAKHLSLVERMKYKETLSLKKYWICDF